MKTIRKKNKHNFSRRNKYKSFGILKEKLNDKNTFTQLSCTPKNNVYTNRGNEIKNMINATLEKKV